METYAFIAVLANKRDNETVKFEKKAKQSREGGGRMVAERVHGIEVAFASIILFSVCAK